MEFSRFFKTKDAAPGVTLIEGVAREYCYLVEGTDRALLIDALTGIGDLKAFCAELTNLPLSVVNTHGHLDHAGGNFVFDGIFIHPADIPLMYGSCGVSRRVDFAETARGGPGTAPNWSASDLAPVREIPCRTLAEGDRFDLGGRTLEVIATPGHTKGSVCFLDRVNRVLFAGDSCNTNVLIYIEGSTTIEEYLDSMKKLKAISGAFDALYICHEETPLDISCIDDVISCCDDILSGKDDAQPGENLGKPCLYAKKRNERLLRVDGRIGNVAYTRDKIFTAR